MDLKQIVALALQFSVIATVFGFGLKATMDDLLYVVRRPGLLVRSLLAMLVIMPLLALLLVRAFDFARTVEIVLLALAISPVPPLLPNREQAANARVSYGLGLMVTLGLLSIVTVPLAIDLSQRIFGMTLGVSPAVIARLMMLMLVGPVAAGLLLRVLAPGLAERIAAPVHMLALILLVLASLVLLVASLSAIWGLVGDGTLVALALFVVIGLVVGHVLGGPDPDRQGVLALSTACRHPIIAMTIASTNFPQERFGGVIILYLLVNVVLSIPYIVWQKKKSVAR